MTDEADRAEFRRRLAEMSRHFAEAVPHNRMLGLEILSIGESNARFRLPYSERLVGNASTGVLHGGAITALIDAACGAAVFAALDTPTSIATLDLRIDYLRPATSGEEVIADAECYRVARNVAFVRAVAAHESGEQIASAAGSFMLGTKSGSRTKKANP